MLVNTLTIFLVSITFFRAIYGLGANVTTIESWEIDRHEQLLRRARALGGYLDGPDGIRIRIVRTAARRAGKTRTVIDLKTMVSTRTSNSMMKKTVFQLQNS